MLIQKARKYISVPRTITNQLVVQNISQNKFQKATKMQKMHFSGFFPLWDNFIQDYERYIYRFPLTKKVLNFFSNKYHSKSK